MKSLLYAISGVILGVAGVLVIMATWGDCAASLTKFLDDNVTSILRPTAEKFGMSTGNLFSSPNGACRKWWADLSWVIGSAFVLMGAMFLASASAKMLKPFWRSSAGSQ